MYKGSIYAGGPIKGLSYDDATNWRTYLNTRLSMDNILVRSPMRFREFLKDFRSLPGTLDHPLLMAKGMISRDKYDIKESDLVFFNLLGAKIVSIATMIEYGLSEAYDKPIITVIERSGNIHEHIWIDELTDYRVQSIDEGIEIVKAIII